MKKLKISEYIDKKAGKFARKLRRIHKYKEEKYKMGELGASKIAKLKLEPRKVRRKKARKEGIEFEPQYNYKKN